MMSVGRLASVALDCADPMLLAQFWEQMLGGEIGFASDDFVAVGLPSGLWLGAYRVDSHAAPAWPDSTIPKQFHLDIGVDDLDIAEKTVIELGGAKAEHQPQPDKWRVYLDPAGHPFCTTVQVPDVADILTDGSTAEVS